MKRRNFFSNVISFLSGMFLVSVTSDEIERVKKKLTQEGYKNITVESNPYGGKGYMIKAEK